MEWLKIIYETLGLRYPRGSLAVVSVLGALISGGGWYVLGKQVRKELLGKSNPRSPIQQLNVIGPAVTTGNNSPAVTGNGNSIDYSNIGKGSSGGSKKPQ